MQRNGINRKRIIIEIVFSILAVVLIVVDQVTKTVCKNNFKNNGWTSTTVIDGFLYFSYAFNTGAAWSFLAGVSWAQTFFKILTVVALAVFFVYYVFICKKNYKLLRVGVIFIISGTIGNFIDRVAYGGVVDFISVLLPTGKFFPTFNMADSYMTVGIIILFIHYLFIDKNALFGKKDGNKTIDG